MRDELKALLILAAVLFAVWVISLIPIKVTAIAIFIIGLYLLILDLVKTL